MRTSLTAVLTTLLICALALPAPAAATSAPYRVKDIRAGWKGSVPLHLTALDEAVIFTAAGGGKGRELWRSDGTAAGTYRLKDIRPGRKTSNPIGLVRIGDLVYFSANDGPHGQELWVTDGTTTGTHLVKDIAPGKTGSTWAGLDAPVAVDLNGVAYLSTVGDGQLWRSDGTEEGTYPILGAPAGIGLLTAFGNRVYFTAGDRLWRSNGTTEGTKKVRGKSGFFVKAPQEMVAADTLLFFGYKSSKLWRSDGTKAGTYKVLDTGAGCTGYSCDPMNLSAAGGLAYFTPLGVPGIAVWRSDGTPEGTFSLVRTDAAGTDMFEPVGDEMYFYANYVWRTDGTVDGTRVVDVPAGLVIWKLFDVDGDVYYSLWDGSEPPKPQLYSTDGTAAGTTLIGPPSPAFPGELTVVGDLVFFYARDKRGYELWAMSL